MTARCPDTAIQWLAQFPMWSRERLGLASRSELRRWFDAGNVRLNGEIVAWNEPMDFPLFSVVLFPHGKRVTLW